MPKSVAVQIESMTFNSLKDACAYLKIKDTSALGRALRKGHDTYKGMKISKNVSESQLLLPIQNTETKQTTVSKKACPVYCETLHKTFKTIMDAAKFANVNDWTMSVKMKEAGQFVDANGNVYKRLRPMNTKNTYPFTGDTLTKTVHRKCRSYTTIQKTETKTVSEVKPVIETVKEPVNNQTISETVNDKEEKMNLVKGVLKEKMWDLIQKEDFTQAKNIMGVFDILK